MKPNSCLYATICECEKVGPLYDEFVAANQCKCLCKKYNWDDFDFMFGVSDDNFVACLTLCCSHNKFQEVKPNVIASKKLIEYCMT